MKQLSSDGTQGVSVTHVNGTDYMFLSDKMIEINTCLVKTKSSRIEDTVDIEFVCILLESSCLRTLTLTVW